jgi:hypothetical protein
MPLYEYKCKTCGRVAERCGEDGFERKREERDAGREARRRFRDEPRCIERSERQRYVQNERRCSEERRR